MMRAITAMDDTETMRWVLADNSVIQVDRAELKEALRLAGDKQSHIWIEEEQQA